VITAVRTIIMLSLAALAAGCYESTDVTSFEPGVYKGQSDPLLDADADERAQTLQERFATVQADR
jgi:hypothetical protein